MNKLIKMLLLGFTCGTLIISCGGGGGGGDPVQPETTETMEPEMADNNPPPSNTVTEPESTEVCLVSICDNVANALPSCYDQYPRTPEGANDCYSLGCAGAPEDDLCEGGECDTTGTNFPSCYDGLTI